MFRDLPALVKAHCVSRQTWSPKEALLGKDRRAFYRVPQRLECRMDSRLFGLEAEGKVLNLSLGGSSISTSVTWPEGSQIRLFIAGLDFHVAAVICFRAEQESEFRYGVKFQKVSFRQLLRLRKILRQNYKGPLVVR